MVQETGQQLDQLCGIWRFRRSITTCIIVSLYADGPADAAVLAASLPDVKVSAHSDIMTSLTHRPYTMHVDILSLGQTDAV